MDSYCVCCLGDEDLNPLLEPDLGYTDILRDFFMIKMFSNDSDVSDVSICLLCVRRLEETKLFKEQVLNSCQTLEANQLIKTRKGRGGFLFVKKLKQESATVFSECDYVTEILDEDLLTLDDILTNSSLVSIAHVKDELSHASNVPELNSEVIVEIESVFQDVEYIIQEKAEDDLVQAVIVPGIKRIEDPENVIGDNILDSRHDEIPKIQNFEENVVIESEIQENLDGDIIEYSIIESNGQIKRELKNLLENIEKGENEDFDQILDLPVQKGKKITGKKNVNISQKLKLSSVKKNKLYTVNPDLKCDHCQQILPNQKVYHSHMNAHFPNHVCSVCGKGFISEKRLKRHIPSHEKGPFECNICYKVFTNYNTMNSHRQRKHKEVKLYKCTMCEERFVTFNRRIIHLADVHGQSERKYKCEMCSMQFLMSGNLSAHMRRVHQKVKRHYCPQCDAGFYLRQDLVGHLATHTGTREHRCTLCLKCYPRKNALAVHLRTHTDDRRYVCNECGRRFLQKITLQCHLKVHERRRTQRQRIETNFVIQT